MQSTCLHRAIYCFLYLGQWLAFFVVVDIEARNDWYSVRCLPFRFGCLFAVCNTIIVVVVVPADFLNWRGDCCDRHQ